MSNPTPALLHSIRVKLISSSFETHQISISARVLIGLSLIPRPSGERSSGAMQEWLDGLEGFEPLLDDEAKCGCLWKPNPIRKNSIGTSMANGCSSVTNEPHALTSTRVQFFLPILSLICTDSAWNGLLSPTKISVLHCNFFKSSVRSCLLHIFFTQCY